MPVTRCKEKEGQADACKKDIVYLGADVTALLGGASDASKKEKAGQAGQSPTPKKRYLTLKCIDGHIHNYEVTQ